MRVAVVLSLAVGCGSSRLVDATRSYACPTRTITAELKHVPAIVGDICRKRVELTYLHDALVDPASATSFERYYAAPGSDHPSWQTRCPTLRRLGDSVGELVERVARYAEALAGASSASLDLDADVAAVVGELGDAIAAASAIGAPIGKTLAGAGAPLGKLATAIAGRWRAHRHGELAAAWRTGDSQAANVAAAMATMAVTAADDLHALEEASR